VNFVFFKKKNRRRRKRNQRKRKPKKAAQNNKIFERLSIHVFYNINELKNPQKKIIKL
jgi:hypothetical protein